MNSLELANSRAAKVCSFQMTLLMPLQTEKSERQTWNAIIFHLHHDEEMSLRVWSLKCFQGAASGNVSKFRYDKFSGIQEILIKINLQHDFSPALQSTAACNQVQSSGCKFSDYQWTIFLASCLCNRTFIEPFIF